MDLEMIRPREVSQRTQMPWDTAYRWDLKHDTKELTKQKQRLN